MLEVISLHPYPEERQEINNGDNTITKVKEAPTCNISLLSLSSGLLGVKVLQNVKEKLKKMPPNMEE